MKIIPLDQDRLRLIFDKELSYYGAHQAPIRKDGRLNFGPNEFLANEFQPIKRGFLPDVFPRCFSS